MKKKIVFILTLCLVLALTFALIACGKDDADSGDDANTEQTGGGSTTDFDYAANAVNAQLTAMQNGNGYLIRYDVSGTDAALTSYSSVAIGAKGNVYYVADQENQYYYDLSDNTCFVEYHKIGNGEWSKTVSHYRGELNKDYYADLMNITVASHGIWMTYYDSFVASMGDDMTKTSATIAGRACDKYTFSAGALVPGGGIGVVRATYACCIDKATSICLKWEATSTYNGTTESAAITCVEFNVNPTFTLPTVSGNNTYVDGEIVGDDNQGENGQGGEQGQQQGGNENQGAQGGEQGQQQGASSGTIAADYPNASNTSIVDALIADGFRVTYTLGARVDENDNTDNTGSMGTYTFAAKGDLFYIVSSGTQAYFDFGESNDYYVDYRLNNGNWTRTNVSYEDSDYANAAQAKQALRATINSYMTLGNYSAITGLTKTSETYLDRNVDKYKKQTTANGETEEYLIRVDKRTGATLFFYFNAYPAGNVGYTYVVSHMATEFQVGYNVVLPEVASNATTIGAKHNPADLLAALNAEAARKNGLSVRLVFESDEMRDVYELWIKNNKMEFTFTSTFKDSGDELSDCWFLVDATTPNSCTVYEKTDDETEYVLVEQEYYRYYFTLTEDVENIEDYLSIFGVLGDYYPLLTEDATLSEDTLGDRPIDVYTLTESGVVLHIDQATHALLYRKDADKSYPTYDCESFYNDQADEIALPEHVVGD